MVYNFSELYISDKLKCQIKNFFDDGGHVVVLVLGEATAEEDIPSPVLPNRKGAKILGKYNTFLVSELSVGFHQSIIRVVVHGVVGLHAFLVLGAVLFADDSLGTVVDFLTEHLEVLVLDDSGVGFIMTGVVDYSVALVVGGVLHAGLERDGAPVELS